MRSTYTFEIPDKVVAKLATGEYNRTGGVIQDQGGKVVMWLREGTLSPLSPNELSSSLPANFGKMLELSGSVASIMNIGATVAFGMATLSKLNKMDKKLDIIIEKLHEIERKIDKIQWTVEIGFANTLQALDILKKYQEIELAGELNSATSLAWSCQFLEPESTKRVMRLEQALSKSSGVVEKLLLHTAGDMNQAIEWMINKRKKEFSFEIDELVIQALFRFRQTCTACAVNAAINAEADDLHSAGVKLQQDQETLSRLLYQLVNPCIESKEGKIYQTLMDQSMLEFMPVERINLWSERFDSETRGLNNVVELLRKEGFSHNKKDEQSSNIFFPVDINIGNIFSHNKKDEQSSNNGVQSITQEEKTKKFFNTHTESFFDLVDGAYDDLERLKGYGLEYRTASTMNISIHEYREMLQINELQDDKQLIFIEEEN